MDEWLQKILFKLLYLFNNFMILLGHNKLFHWERNLYYKLMEEDDF
jgi:hypothetical protein